MEERLQQGIDGLNSGQYSSMYSTAKSVGISETTLRECRNRRKPRRHAYVSQQLLSDSEEKVLVKWITNLTLIGLPPSYSIIELIREAIMLVPVKERRWSEWELNRSERRDDAVGDGDGSAGTVWRE